MWDYLRRPLTNWELDPFFHPASICALGGKYLSPEFESDQFRLSTANVCGEIRKIGEKCSPAIGCLRHFCTTIIPSHLPSTTFPTCKVPLNWNHQLLVPSIIQTTTTWYKLSCCPGSKWLLTHLTRSIYRFLQIFPALLEHQPLQALQSVLILTSTSECGGGGIIKIRSYKSCWPDNHPFLLHASQCTTLFTSFFLLVINLWVGNRQYEMYWLIMYSISG